MEEKGCLLPIALLLLALVLSILAGFQIYPVYADVDALLDRAQVSADADKMARRLDQLLLNMERYGVTRGHAAIVFKHPQNDVGMDYEAIRDLRDRARKIAEFDEASIEYQTGLDDMRGTLREIEINAVYYTMIRSVVFWIALALWVIGAILGFVAIA